MWIGGRGLVIRRAVGAVGLATTKEIGKKRIVIGRDCVFFVVADSVSSLGNLVVYWARNRKGRGDPTRIQFHDQPDPEQ